MLSKCALEKNNNTTTTTTNEWNEENNSGAANFSLLMLFYRHFQCTKGQVVYVDVSNFVRTLSLSFFFLAAFIALSFRFHLLSKIELFNAFWLWGMIKEITYKCTVILDFIFIFFYFFAFFAFLLLFYGVYIVVCFLILQLSTSKILSKVLLWEFLAVDCLSFSFVFHKYNNTITLCLSSVFSLCVIFYVC